MSTFILIIVSPDEKVGLAFLDSLPFRYVKSEYCNFGNPTRYYSLSGGNFLQVEIWSTILTTLYKRSYYDTCLVMWQKSVPESEEKARNVWANLPADKRAILEIFDGDSRPSPEAVSIQDIKECTRVVTELIKEYTRALTEVIKKS